MPGICLATGQNNRQLVEHMSSSIKHEAWYQINEYADSLITISRVHLGIFNPQPQPIFNEDKSLLIFMDGKIYDYEPQLRELELKGHQFSLGNDPEFCLHLYEELGIDFVKQLNGTFVIVIWDVVNRRLLVINDRYGIRPHYYTIIGEQLVLAPEVKAILRHAPIKREMNDEAVAEFFAFGQVLGNKTFFEGIEVLPPASILEYQSGKISWQHYWDYEYQEERAHISEDELAEQLARTFRQAVKRRVKDDHRYAISLSGGLDSRAIVAAIDKDCPMTTITVGIDGCDEEIIARRVAARAGKEHWFIKLQPEALIPYAEKTIHTSDGMDTLMVSNLLFTHEQIRKEFNVLFQGLAGDLLLGGSFLSSLIMKAGNNQELVMAIASELSLYSPDMLGQLFTSTYYPRVKGIAMHSLAEQLSQVPGKHPGNRADRFFLQNRVRRGTIMGSVIARSKLEEAYPTFDNDFIELILRLSPELRLNYRIYKKFLKKLSPELARIPWQRCGVRADAPFALQQVGLICQTGKARLKNLLWALSGGKVFILNRHGYVNFEEWLRPKQGWRDFITEILLDERTLSRGLFNPDYIKRLLDEHGRLPRLRQVGQVVNSKNITLDYSRQLGYLASFEISLRQFVDS